MYVQLADINENRNLHLLPFWRKTYCERPNILQIYIWAKFHRHVYPRKMDLSLKHSRIPCDMWKCMPPYPTSLWKVESWYLACYFVLNPGMRGSLHCLRDWLIMSDVEKVWLKSEHDIAPPWMSMHKSLCPLWQKIHQSCSRNDFSSISCVNIIIIFIWTFLCDEELWFIACSDSIVNMLAESVPCYVPLSHVFMKQIIL